jgi:hypothetical protein
VSASAARKKPDAISRKPMARAVKVTLFEREMRERLSASAIEILFQRARVLSEGRRSDSPTARAAYFGSTMLTLDLAELSDVIRDAASQETAQKLAAMIEEDARVQKRVRQIAAAEAEHIAGGPCGARAVELRVRTEGAIVYLDIDVEGPAGKS